MKTIRSRNVVLGAWLAAVVVVAGCGDGGGDADAGTDVEQDVTEDSTPDVDPDAGPDADPDAPADAEEEFDPTKCEGFVEGWNAGFDVDGTMREFLLDLPEGVDTDGPWPVIFNWHGMGDTASNMRNLLVGEVDNTTMPFILVTPEDTNVTMLGLVVDWWVHEVDDGNMEAMLFDEVLLCLDHLYGVDPDRVHSVGMSMGGFVTDMLGTIRGEEVASIATYSGAYGSNPANLEGSMLAMVVDWPEHSVTNPYEHLFLHGGTADTYPMGLETLHFDQYAVNDAAFLNTRGHDVVICDHGGGHTIPAGFMGERLVEFFADHPRDGAGSAWATDGLPAGYPEYCAFQGAD